MKTPIFIIKQYLKNSHQNLELKIFNLIYPFLTQNELNLIKSHFTEFKNINKNKEEIYFFEYFLTDERVIDIINNYFDKPFTHYDDEQGFFIMFYHVFQLKNLHLNKLSLIKNCNFVYRYLLFKQKWYMHNGTEENLQKICDIIINLPYVECKKELIKIYCNISALRFYNINSAETHNHILKSFLIFNFEEKNEQNVFEYFLSDNFTEVISFLKYIDLKNTEPPFKIPLKNYQSITNYIEKNNIDIFKILFQNII